jgi:ATP adenylyltransferase
MKNLYSPWRSVYIKTFTEKKPSTGCLFCRILNGRGKRVDANNLVVWRGKLCYVVMNRFPYNSGHVLIVPHRHTSNYNYLTTEELGEIMWATGKCIEALKKVSKPQGFNFGANLGKTAGAGIDKHVHFHIVPRWNGDTNFMPVLSDVKLVSERLSALQKKLSREMNNKK